MASVDNRIVKMVMDNKAFNKAASETIKVLSTLNEKLKLSQGIEGLKNIASHAKSVNMEPLSTGVDTVTKKFSAMEIAGVTALVNIANRAVNAGINFTKALTIDPITDGFAEYETKMNAIQTILTNTASKGTTLDDINEGLEELNKYSDLTIYNFAQMTDNIGKATAAGVGLEDGITFVKGMANAAAGFGVDATSMAGATQQMTQALASGVIRLQDWMSLENRGMAGEMMQQRLLETAAEMGVYIDTSKGFRYTLEENWLTTDIFMKTMEKMANDQSLIEAATHVKTFTQLIGTMKENVGSGWTMSWEHIIGNKEESTKLFTSISNGFANISNSMADYRNEGLKTWKESGGREAVLNGLKNILESIGKVLGPIYNAFKKIIDPYNGERLMSISKGFEKITEKLKITDKTSKLIGKTFEGVFSIFKVLGQLIRPIISLFTGLSSTGTGLLDAIFGITAAMTSWITKVADFLEKSKTMNKVVELTSKLGNKVGETLKKAFGVGSEFVDKGLDSIEKYTDKMGKSLLFLYEEANKYVDKFVMYCRDFRGVMGEIASAAQDKVNDIKNFIIEFNNAYKPLEVTKEFVINMIESIQNGFMSFIQFMKDCVSSVKNFISSIVSAVQDADVEAIDIINIGMFGGALVFLKKTIPKIIDFIKSPGSLKDSIIGVLDELGGVLEAYQKNIKSNIIIKIAVAIGILAASVFVLSKVDPDRLLPAVGALGGLVAGIMGALWMFDKIDPEDIKKTTLMTVSLIAVAISLNILASALNKLSKLDWAGTATGLTGLAGACLILFGLMKGFEKLKINPKIGGQCMILATALIVLSGALYLLGSIDVKKVLQGLGVMAISLAGFAAFFNANKKINNSVKIASSLIPLTMSLLLLAGALAIFGNMDVGTLIQGFVVLASALAAFSAFANSFRKFEGKIIQVSVGLGILTVTLYALAGALAVFGNMNINTLIQGFMVLSVSLLTLSVGLHAMPSNTKGIASGLFVLSAAMLVLSASLKAMGSLDLWSIIKAMIAMFSSLTIFGAAGYVLKPIIPELTNLAKSLIILGAAMKVMSIGLKGLGSMDLWTIINGLIAMAGTIAVFGIAASALQPVIPLMTSLALGIGAIGVACMAVGAGLIVLSVGLTSLGGSITALGATTSAGLMAICAVIPVFTAAVALGLASFLTTLGYNSDAIERAVGDLLIALWRAITRAIPQFVTAIKTLFSNILLALNELVPQLIATVTNIILKVLESISLTIPQIMETVTQVFSSVLTMITELAPQIIETVVTILMELLQALSEHLPEIMTFVGNFLTEFINLIVEKAPEIVTACIQIVLDVLDALTENLPLVSEKVFNFVTEVITSVLEDLSNAIGPICGKIVDIIVSIIETIGENTVKIINAMFELVLTIINGFADAVETYMPQIRLACKRVIEAIVNNLLGGVGDLVEVGRDLVDGLVNGITGGISRVVNGVKRLGESAIDGLKDLLGIHSPSKEFRKIGVWSMEGLVQGIERTGSSVVNSTKTVGKNAMNSMRKAVSGMTDMLENESNNPVIRPVLDLTDVKKGVSKMNNIIGNDVKVASATSSRFDRLRSVITSDVGNTTNNDNSSVVNNFNITGNNPNEIADKVSRIINNQVERKRVVWE